MASSREVGKSAQPSVQLARDTVLNDSDKTFTVPDGEGWLVRWIFVKLITSATVGNRRMAITVESPDSGNPRVFNFLHNNVQAASGENEYTFAPGLVREAAIGTYHQGPLPHDFVLSPGQRLRVYERDAIDAAADDMEVTVVGDRITIA